MSGNALKLVMSSDVFLTLYMLQLSWEQTFAVREVSQFLRFTFVVAGSQCSYIAKALCKFLWDETIADGC